MRISIVIATYNRAALLRTTLDHLRRQAYQPGDEVIVVDNASTDETAEVLARAVETFPVPVRAVQEMARGKTPALITGLALASGDVLALTDDDVIVADDWLTSIRRAFNDPDLHLLGGRVEPLWERPRPRWLRVEETGRYGMLASPLALLHYGPPQALVPRTAVGANLAVRRDVMDALGGFAPHLGRRAGTLLCGEDHDLCLRATAAGFRCEYRPDVRVRHWVPSSRMRLTYYLRWFYWSGVTHAMLERDTPAGGRVVPRYLVRRVLVALPIGIGRLLAGRPSGAASAIMEGVSALGNLMQRVRDRWRRDAPRAVRSGHGVSPTGSRPAAPVRRPEAATTAGAKHS
jgi:glycosyltransferase involved in cell wall biosynthesis